MVIKITNYYYLDDYVIFECLLAVQFIAHGHNMLMRNN